MKRKTIILLSREDYARCTAEDFERWDIGIAADSYWLRPDDIQKDYEEAADRLGVTFRDFMRGPR